MTKSFGSAVVAVGLALTWLGLATVIPTRAALASTDAARAQRQFEQALVAYDEAVASRVPDHRGFATALEMWRPLAEDGHAGAQYHVGLMHYLGVGGATINQLLGINMIRASAQAGYPTALVFMGLMADRGDGVVAKRGPDIALD